MHFTRRCHSGGAFLDFGLRVRQFLRNAGSFRLPLLALGCQSSRQMVVPFLVLFGRISCEGTQFVGSCVAVPMNGSHQLRPWREAILNRFALRGEAGRHRSTPCIRLVDRVDESMKGRVWICGNFVQ